MMLKPSALPSARPPATTRDALCRSGRPVVAPVRATKRVCEGRATPGSTFSTVALPPVAAASNDATRTVATTLASAGTSTVSTALPA